MGLGVNFIAAGVLGSEEENAPNREQQDEDFASDSSPRHPETALKRSSTTLREFPSDYWRWDETEKEYYHRDEDTGSIVWYGPMD
jgi:hypothetical protein